MSDTHEKQQETDSRENCIPVARVHRKTLTALFCLLALLALVIGVDRLLDLGLFPPALDLKLRAAREAVLSEGTPRAAVASTGRGTLSVPTEPDLSRTQTIEIFLELEGFREKYTQSIMRIIGRSQLSVEAEKIPSELERIREQWKTARGKICELIAIGPERAEMVLAALQWPWPGADIEKMKPEHLTIPFSIPPSGFEGWNPGRWQDLLGETERDLPWDIKAKRLAEEHNLSDRQLRIVRAYLIRRTLVRAFDSQNARRQAQTELERLAALAPFQAREVLAMAGAQELTNTGSVAFPVLIDLLRRNARIGSMLLKRCVETAAVREQARSALQQLKTNQKRATKVLLALGPFGLEAIETAGEDEQLPPVAETIRDRLRKKWDTGKGPLATLGSNPQKWRRWYQRAKNVL